MALVVFLRGVNVGGNKAFSPSALAKGLARFDAVNVGAAGTFVLRGASRAAGLKAEVARRLPVEAEIMVCPAKEVLALAAEYADDALPAGHQRFVTVLAKRPGKAPRLPIVQPAGAGWEIKVVAIPGRYAVSVRRVGGARFYPNEVVEKALGISGTTRNWNTLSTVCRILESR